jgi:asparagine synthase (glutamine-hydrolysing)
MCGICGQIRFDSQSVQTKSLEKMMQKIRRRGPDSQDLLVEKNIGFGHTRLSVIDLSNHATQPMVDKKLGLSLVFNGTIYNYKSLQADLKKEGYQFFSHSDSEVIIKAYHFWGKDCVKHFDGMFAFALWNSKDKSLFVARDRMGIKPLYFHQTKNSFSFASNTQSLLTLEGINKEIDPVALQFQLSLHAVIPAPLTIIKSIRKLKPATTFFINEKGDIVEETYWQPKAQRISGFSDNDYLEKTHELLKEAVKKRVSACDVPSGVLLSGGLDSSLIVGLLDEIGEKNINTFSIGFEDIGNEVGSEFEYSDLIVDKFKTNHFKYVVDNNQVLERLPEAVGQMAEPMVGQDAVAFYLLSEQVSKHIKVVLSGQGADEAFAGYFWYQKMVDEQGDEITKFSNHYVDRPYEEYLETIDKKYHNKNHTKTWLQKQFDKPFADEFIDKVFRMDTTRLIVDDPVKRVDNMTMAWGLEARVPFMDYKLIELALSIPMNIKFKEGGKYPLKKIARQLLPSEVIDRKKGYFPMPALKYVQGDFLEFMKDILKSQACLNRGIFNQNFIDKILAKPTDYMTKLNGSRLWHLALLELWFQINLDE